MTDQPKNNTFMKAFLPGLVLGVIVGAVGWAFLGPMVSNDLPPVKPVKGADLPAGTIPPPPPDAIDERAPIKPPAATPDAPKQEAPKTEAAKQPDPAPAPK